MMATALTTPDNTVVWLPVIQAKESHDLVLDVNQVGTAGALVVAPPYQAMSVGDKATLSVKLYLAGEYFDTLTQTKNLNALDIGQPIQWTVPQAELEILYEGDHLEFSYSIVYATPTVATASAAQTLQIIPLASSQRPTNLLPALKIKGHTGDTLNPEHYPEGITLIIEPNADMHVDDYVLVYAIGDTRVVMAVRVDQTTVDSQTLAIPLGYAWLAANTNQRVSLMYQYARVGSAGSSQPLALTLRRTQDLPPPLIKDVVREGEDDEYKGYLLGRLTTNGITVDIDPQVVIGDKDKVQMFFDGFKPGGHYIAGPTVGNPRRFQIPKQYVPANLGKRLSVSYELTVPDELPDTSKRFDLQIRDMASGWPNIQITAPASPNNIVSLKSVTDAVIFRLQSWTFMAEGQQVRIYVKGVLQGGGEGRLNLREGTAEVVAEDEYYAGEIEAKLSFGFLSKLRLNQQFDVIVEISFDGGFSYKRFPIISPTLVE